MVLMVNSNKSLLNLSRDFFPFGYHSHYSNIIATIWSLLRVLEYPPMNIIGGSWKFLFDFDSSHYLPFKYFVRKETVKLWVRKHKLYARLYSQWRWHWVLRPTKHINISLYNNFNLVLEYWIGTTWIGTLQCSEKKLIRLFMFYSGDVFGPTIC